MDQPQRTYNNQNNHFIGYYFKHATDDNTLAIIVGFTNNEEFIQIITEDESIYLPYHENDIIIKQGLLINIEHDDVNIHGYINYQNFTPLKHHIMGPFKHFRLPCYHNINSMHHNIYGTLIYNDKQYDFHNGHGYIESDEGTSFPKHYVWLQANQFSSNTYLSLAIADLSLFNINFKGIIAALIINDKEFIFATYKGCKLIKLTENEIEIKQGKYQLAIKVTPNNPQTLKAPTINGMTRDIKECLVCDISYKLYKCDELIFTDQGKGSYEWVYASEECSNK